MFCSMCHLIDIYILFIELIEWICAYDYVVVYIDIIHSISEFMLNYTAMQSFTGLCCLPHCFVFAQYHSDVESVPGTHSCLAHFTSAFPHYTCSPFKAETKCPCAAGKSQVKNFRWCVHK